MKRIINNLLVGVVAVITSLSLMYAAAAGLAVVHTAFPTPDTGTNFGLFSAVENLNTILNTNQLSKVVVNNNAANPYQVPSNTAYVLMTGTQPSSTMTISMPSAANSLDSQEVTIFSASAVSSSITFASSGASVVGAPATLAADSTLKFKYDAPTTSWIVVGH